jgi:glycosyltransferase involved in cell wall biosynthesis
MKKKIVFILSSIYAPRVHKRINEFIENGYDVSVFGFDRKETVTLAECSYEVQALGDFSSCINYHNRLWTYYKGIQQVRTISNSDEILYYLFGLDVGLWSFLFKKKKYIYEEADMTHLNIRNKMIGQLLELLDIKIIKRSLLSVFTSEGFLLYHFPKKKPENVIVVPNRLSTNVLQYTPIPKRDLSISKLRIGFVGVIRYDSIASFAEYFLYSRPNCEFHFYGKEMDERNIKFQQLKQYPNCFFHGPFVTPVDLSAIYSNIDLVLSTYDARFTNVLYAEPNKLYEAIYFNTPIIVTVGTFLSHKVEEMQIGYSVDPFSPESMERLLINLTSEDINRKVKNIKAIDKMTAINSNNRLFEKLSSCNREICSTRYK